MWTVTKARPLYPRQRLRWAKDNSRQWRESNWRSEVSAKHPTHHHPNPTQKAGMIKNHNSAKNAWGICKEKLLWISDSRKHSIYMSWTLMRQDHKALMMLRGLGEFSFLRNKKYCSWGYSVHDEGFMTRMLNLMTAFLSTVTRLSADPGHMLELQHDDLWPPTHVISLTFSETSPPQRSDEGIQLRSHTTQTLGKIIFFLLKCGILRMWTLQPPAVKRQQLGGVELCLYWHTVMFQLSSMKQHVYNI